jgi:zinc protease
MINGIKSSFKFLIVLLSGLALISCATIGKSSYQIKKYEEVTLDNGLQVLLIHDDSLPYMTMTMLVKAGSSQDLGDRPGIGYLTTELIDKGTTNRSAQKVADDLALMGADFRASTDSDYSILEARSLSEYEDNFIKLFSEIVTQPAFPNNEVSRTKKQTMAMIQKLVDEPRGFSSLVHESQLYGSHPYSQPSFGSRKSIESIKKKDIVKHYLKFFRPNNAILAITGDFDQKNVRAKVAAAFANWSSRDVVNPQSPPIAQVQGTKVLVVDKKGLNQAQILFGRIGITRNDPDFLNLRLATTVLGGAFHSRLMNEVRTKRGLTYGISSAFDARLEKGPFVISTFTRNDKVGETVGTTLQVLKDFVDKGVNQQELESAKQLMKGQFPRSLETPEALARNMLLLKFYSIPFTYLQNYYSLVNKLTVSSVNTAIKKHLSPESMLITLYTDSNETVSQVKPFGEVQSKKSSDFF